MEDAQNKDELDERLENCVVQFGDSVISQIMREDQRCQQQKGMIYEEKPTEAAALFPETSRTVSNSVSSVGVSGKSQYAAAAAAAASSRLSDNNAYLEKSLINCNVDINNDLVYKGACLEKGLINCNLDISKDLVYSRGRG